MFGLLFALLFQAPAASQDTDLQEAVFRYLFVHNQSGLQQRAKAYHLCLGGIGEKQRDPAPDLLGRFKTHQPPVRACSSFSSKGNKTLAFHIARIEKTDATHAEVTAGYYEGNLSSAESVLMLELKNGKWQVTGAALQTIARR